MNFKTITGFISYFSHYTGFGLIHSEDEGHHGSSSEHISCSTGMSPVSFVQRSILLNIMDFWGLKTSFTSINKSVYFVLKCALKPIMNF